MPTIPPTISGPSYMQHTTSSWAKSKLNPDTQPLPQTKSVSSAKVETLPKTLTKSSYNALRPSYMGHTDSSWGKTVMATDIQTLKTKASETFSSHALVDLDSDSGSELEEMANQMLGIDAQSPHLAVKQISLDSEEATQILQNLVKRTSSAVQQDGVQPLFTSNTSMPEASDGFMASIEKMKATPTGRGLLTALINSPVRDQLEIIVSKGNVSGGFMPPNHLGPGNPPKPTITWSATQPMLFFDTVVKLDDFAIPRKFSEKNDPNFVQKYQPHYQVHESQYPPELVLLHELGHVKQYIDNPSFLNNYSENMHVIEMDNLARHESPAAQEMGLPVRIDYNFTRENDMFKGCKITTVKS